MIIEDIDALQIWLTQTLSPVCDADPQALAKYVVALVKKDKPVEELRSVCHDQLDVFLQEKTKEFVDRLFIALDDDSYITPETKPPKPAAPPVVAIIAQLESGVEQNNTLPANKESDNNQDAKTKEEIPRKKTRSRSRSPYSRGRDLGTRDLRRFINQRRTDDKRPGSGPRYTRRYSPDYRSRRQRSPRRSRSPGARARSRSHGRTRSPGARPRSRSQGRARSPGARSRSPGRTRSPGSGARTRSPGRTTRSPVPGQRPRSRSAGHQRSRSPRGRSPARPRSRSPRRSRSRSRERFRSRSPRPYRARQKSKSWSRSLSPFSDSLSGGSRRGSKSKSPATRHSSDSRGSTPLNDSPRYSRLAAPTAPTAYNKPKIRCRDFDVQGYCMQGDMCPYDHGVDPVVVDDVNLSNVLPFSQGGPRPPAPVPSVRPQMMHFPEGGPRPPAPISSVRPQMDPRPQGPRGPPMPPQGPPPPGMPGHRPPPPGHTPIHQRLGPNIRPGGNEPMGYVPSAPGPMPPRPPNHPWAHPSGPMMQQRPPPPPPPPPQSWQPPPPRGQDVLVVRTAENNSNNVALKQEEVEGAANVEDKNNLQQAPPQRTVIAGGKRPYSDGPGYYHRGGGPANKRGGGYHRGGRGGRRPFNPQHLENATIELRKVPPNLNNISAINEHFSKFGHITNIQVCYKGESDATLLTFASHSQASAAYRSSEPVLNNRFVKVFWHRKDENPDQPQQPAAGETGSQNSPPDASSAESADKRASVKDRLGIPPAHKLTLNNTKPVAKKEEEDTATSQAIVVSPTGSLTKTVFNPSALSSRLAPDKSLLATRRRDHSTRQALKKTVELNRQKQQLLQKQIEQQKKLLQKLDSNKKMAASDKALIISTIKILAASIEKLKKEITESSQTMKKVTPVAPVIKPADTPPVTPTDTVTSPIVKDSQTGFIDILNATKKAILDTELDLMSKSHGVSDTSELRKKVAELKKEAMSLGLLGGRGGRGGHRYGRGGRLGRGSLEIVRSLDKRPRELMLSGYDPTEKEAVVTHMATFGTVVNVVHDDAAPSVIISYETRQQAEKAVREGFTFKGKHLMMAWHKPPPKPKTPTTPAAPSMPEPTVMLASRRLSSCVSIEAADDLDEPTDDDPLEGEDLVGGPASLMVGDDDDDLEEVDEDVLLGLDDEESEEDSPAWKR